MEMKTRLLTTLSLVAVLLAACAPSAVPAQPSADQAVANAPTATFPPPVPTLESSIQPTDGPIQDLAPTALPVATSRGPDLEATDPLTVNLASGNLHFVEFFRFT